MTATAIDPTGGSSLVVQSLDPAAAGMCSAALFIYIVAPFVVGLVCFAIAPMLDDLHQRLAGRRH